MGLVDVDGAPSAAISIGVAVRHYCEPLARAFGLRARRAPAWRLTALTQPWRMLLATGLRCISSRARLIAGSCQVPRQILLPNSPSSY